MNRNFWTHEINLSAVHECDVRLVFPNGKVMELQYRLEAPSIDVVLPDNLHVTNWQGDDMRPADPASATHFHVLLAKQLVIDFDPQWLEAEETPDDDNQARAAHALTAGDSGRLIRQGSIAMKMTPLHYEILSAAIQRTIREWPSMSLEAYLQAGMTENRWRWDLFNKAQDEGYIDIGQHGHNFYSYLNDNHIETALRAITKTH